MRISFAFYLPFLFAGALLAGKLSERMPDNNSVDGPYVFYKNGKVYINYIKEKNELKLKVDSYPESDKGNIKLEVATDNEGKTFDVWLKKKLQNEKSEFSGVDKMFVISDIEGEFTAFRKLLQAHHVIDDNYIWTFGTGHLVLTGDFFDRGTQVTEVLWLIYSLEEKAKEAGGYVHFILGNHEIMNLNNDLRYVHPKYMRNAALMNESYLNLYSEQTELGRWLRTKNITEKIGNILFMHAGISDIVNSMELPVSRLNKLARPFYADTTYKYDDPQVDVLYSDLGPFWYRGYYYGTPKAGISQIDSTLSFYRVKHIATGHTVISDTIRVLFNGKLINTDVHHSKGKSEALLVENGKFYRATPFGEKFLVLQ